MLYKFKSKATGDLIMLEPQGKQILRLIGKDPGAKGIILTTEMNAAIAALQAAVALEEQAHQELASAELQGADAQAARPAVDGPRSISLKQRVVPFIDMLRRAQAEDKEVVWGV
jgi:cyclopropane-fatty-acyl-phospholipid synthase